MVSYALSLGLVSILYQPSKLAGSVEEFHTEAAVEPLYEKLVPIK